ncbi:hypothetical protein RFI_40271, partial [Reticulomyxa filosa]
MSKEDKFIETAEDKEIEKEDNSASTSAERHNDIEEEYQYALEEAEEMEANINKLIAKKKIPWETETSKIIQKGEIHEIWYSRQLTEKQLKRLQKRARYVKKKTCSFLHDNSNNDV